MIENMSPRSGRVLKEDDSVVNIADLLEGQAYAQNTAIATGTAEFGGSDSANTHFNSL